MSRSSTKLWMDVQIISHKKPSRLLLSTPRGQGLTSCTAVEDPKEAEAAKEQGDQSPQSLIQRSSFSDISTKEQVDNVIFGVLTHLIRKPDGAPASPKAGGHSDQKPALKLDCVGSDPRRTTQRWGDPITSFL